MSARGRRAWRERSMGSTARVWPRRLLSRVVSERRYGRTANTLTMRRLCGPPPYSSFTRGKVCATARLCAMRILVWRSTPQHGQLRAFHGPPGDGPKSRVVPRSDAELVELLTRAGERVVALFGRDPDGYAETTG